MSMIANPYRKLSETELKMTYSMTDEDMQGLFKEGRYAEAAESATQCSYILDALHMAQEDKK